MPPAGSVLAASAEGINGTPAGPLVRHFARTSARGTRASGAAWTSATAPPGHGQTPSPSASPGHSLRSVPAVPLTWLPGGPTPVAARAVPSTASVAQAQNAALPAPSVAPQPPEQRGPTRRPEDADAAAQTAAEELQAAAESMGLEGESDEHRWFFEKLRKGLTKRAKKNEQDALRREEREEEVMNYGKLEAAALARCREELQAAEQRSALEEAVLATQAEVAEIRMKQQMTEEMAQQALVGRCQACQRLQQDSPSRRAEQSSCSQMEEHALFKDVRLPLYTKDRLRSMAPRELLEHALLVRATLGGLVSDVPEAMNDVINWIVDAQREHLEILPELEKHLAAAVADFEPAGFANGSTASGSFDSSHQSPSSALNRTATNAKVAAVQSPQANSRPTVNLASPSPGGTSSPVTPTKWASPLSVSSPPVVARSSPASSVLLSGARTSPATSTRSEFTPCGSARKLPDNDVRVLTPSVGLKLADRLGPVRLQSAPQVPRAG